MDPPYNGSKEPHIAQPPDGHVRSEARWLRRLKDAVMPLSFEGYLDHDASVGTAIVQKELPVEAKVIPSRADRQPRDEGQAIISVTMPQQRGLPHRRPRAMHRRGQHEAGFVDENQVGAQPREVFFIPSQAVSVHRWMAPSFRSRARRSGF